MRTGGKRVGPEFRADGVVVGVVALTINAIRRTVVAVLIDPDDDVAAVRQTRHRWINLLASTGTVNDALGTQRYRTVGLRRHVDLHRARIARPTVAIAHPYRYRAAGDRVRYGIGVSEVLDQLLDGIGCGVGVELYGQLVAVGAITEDRADGHAGKTHRVTGNTDLPRSASLIADAKLILVIQTLQAQLILRTIVGQVIDFEQAAVEVGRISVEQADPGIDQLRRGIDGVLGKRDAGRHIDQQRVGLAHEVRGIAIKLLEYLIGVVPTTRRVVVVGPADDEGAIGEPQHHRRGARAVGVVRIDQRGPIQAQSIRIELLRPDATIIIPRHREPAVRQGGDRRFVFITRRLRVDPELTAHGHTGAVVDLPEHAVAAAAVLSGGAPDNDKAAAGQAHDM